MSPMIAKQPLTYRMKLLHEHPEVIKHLTECNIDVSIVSEHQLHALIVEHKLLEIKSRNGENIEFSFHR